MNDLCETGDEMTDQYYICNIHRGVLYHFVGNSNVCEKTKWTNIWQKKEIFLGFQMGFAKFP